MNGIFYGAALARERHLFMKSCAFFGHSHLHCEPYREKLLGIICDLIENKGVAHFYSGYRGNFDYYCRDLIYELKEKYPFITMTKVLSYIPQPLKPDEYGFVYRPPINYDDSVYLLDRQVPYRLAIIETNKLLVDKVDYIVAGVLNHCGGACMALEYACKKKKPIFNIFEDWEP